MVGREGGGLHEAGDVVELDYVERGHTVALHYVTVLEDTPQRTALALVPGSTIFEAGYHRPPDPNVNRAEAAVETWKRGPPKLVPSQWTSSEIVHLLEPERWYAIYHMWNAKTGDFMLWYVNFQEPYVRTPAGFHTRDLALDLVVGPDFQTGLKDEHEFATFVEHGFIDSRTEHEVWRARDEVLERIEQRRFPFDGTWLDRRPANVAPTRRERGAGRVPISE